MIIITGSVVTTPETVDLALAHSLAHVQRSRLEEGCLFHSVHRDLEDPLRLVFLERWLDRASVDRHFAQPASGQFVRDLAACSDSPPTLEFYEAEPISLG